MTMATALVSYDLSELEVLAKGLGSLDANTLGGTAIRTVNEVTKRGFATAKRQMLSGVALSESYVNERMTVEEATDPKEPTATIIAFRPGGKRKPATKPVNLRQYAARIEQEFTNWRNDGTARNSGRQVFVTTMGGVLPKGQAGAVNQGAMYENPRKPGSKLPFKKRIGNQVLGLPVGTKAKDISVEVRTGNRKIIRPSSKGFKAFMQRMPNGEVLLMRRTTKTGGKGNKGKMESLHSLSVWQLFNAERTKAKIIPLIMADLESTAVSDFSEQIEKAFKL